MRPFYEDEWIKIYHSDSQNLSFIPDNSIEMVITSPPYNVGMPYSGNQTDRKTIAEFMTMLENVFKECYRVLKKGGRIAVNVPSNIRQHTSSRQAFLAFDVCQLLRKIGFLDREWITWIKSYPPISIADFRLTYKHRPWQNLTSWGSWKSPSDPAIIDNAEYIIVMHKESPKLEGDKEKIDITAEEFIVFASNTWFLRPVSEKESGHPAAFPFELPYRLLKFYTYKENTVLDPFCGCYDEETEILTSSGWKYFRDLSLEDEVASLENGNLKFVKPLNLFKYYYEGFLYHFKGKHFDLLVTPEHNMYVIDRHKRIPVFKKAKEVSLYDEMIRNCNWQGEIQEKFTIPSLDACKHLRFQKIGFSKKGKQVFLCKDCKRSFRESDGNPQQYGRSEIEIETNTFLEFLGFYLSEGWCRIDKRGNSRIAVIEISQATHKERIQQILEKLPFNFTYIDSLGRFRIFNLQLVEWLIKNCGRTSIEKKIPNQIKNLDKSHLKYLLEGLLLGDGYKRGEKWQFYTTSKQLADDVQEIGIKLGYSCQISAQNRIGRKIKMGNRILTIRRILYTVNASLKHSTPKINKKPSLEKYKGMVFCAEVPSHILLVRRKGKAVWCGNSGTVGVVAKQLRRKAILVDISKEYCELAAKKCSQEYLSFDFEFIKDEDKDLQIPLPFEQTISQEEK